jgi:hypothetical protein
LQLQTVLPAQSTSTGPSGGLGAPVVHEGPSAALLADQTLIDRFLGLSH